MNDLTIEDLIKKYLVFPNGISPQGWYKIYCEVCGDGEGRTKGMRGGWKFPEENVAVYRCFNCGCSAVFNAEHQFPYSKRMREVLDAFGIPKEEYGYIAYKNRLENSPATNKQNVKKESKLEIIPIPDYFYKLSEASPENLIAQKAKKFLWEKKQIKPEEYDFYLSSGVTKLGPKEEIIAKMLMNKIIIPYFKNGNMIYYQARYLDQKKFMNVSKPRSSVIYGFDRLYTDLERPLFITEGFWDAFHLNGVAVLENNITSEQVDIISRSPRRKIVVPDKRDDTKKLANAAIELGWEVALPEIGYCDDVTDAIIKYGKIFTLNSIVSHIYQGYEASINLDLY